MKRIDFIDSTFSLIEQLSADCDGVNSFNIAVIEKAQEGICVFHEISKPPYVRFSVWNARMTEISGYSMDEINRNGWFQSVYPDSEMQKEAVLRMARMKEGDDLSREDWEITRKNGEKRILRISTSVLTCHDGKKHVLVFMDDQTERIIAFRELEAARNNLENRVMERTFELKNANTALEKEIQSRKTSDEALRFSEEKYRKLFESERNAHMIFDVETFRLEDANNATLALFGYRKDEFLNLTVLDISSEKDETRNNVALLSKDYTNGFCVPLRYFIKNDGAVFPGEISATKFMAGGRKKVLGVVNDISERLRREDELKEIQSKLIASGMELESLIQTSPDIIYRLDENGRIVFISSAIMDYGYTPNELIGKDIMTLVHPDDKENTVRRMKERRTGGRRTTSLEVRFISKNKKIIPFEVKERKIPDYETFSIDAEGVYEAGIAKKELFKGTQGVARDVSERRILEARLIHSQKKEALAALAGGIAHQFNNSLATITGVADLVELDFGGQEGLEGYISTLRKTAEKMRHLTAQLLGYAEGGKYRPEAVLPNEFLKETLLLLEHIIDPRIHLHLDADGLFPKVYMDKTQIQMVMSAVLSNAVEAIIDEGDIHITLSDKVIDGHNDKDIMPKKKHDDDAGMHDLPEKRYICFTIADNGIGMDDKTKKRVFEPFFTTKFIGRGMGMAAAFGIVKNHGGGISVDSSPGKGSAVHIYLPAMSDAEKTK